MTLYLFEPEKVRKIAPILTKKIDIVIKNNKIPDLTKFINIIKKIKNF